MCLQTKDKKSSSRIKNFSLNNANETDTNKKKRLEIKACRN